MGCFSKPLSSILEVKVQIAAFCQIFTVLLQHSNVEHWYNAAAKLYESS